MTEPVNLKKQAVEEAAIVSSHETAQEPGMSSCLSCAKLPLTPLV